MQFTNETAPAEIVNIATDTQILTSRPEKLNSMDISIAASIAEKILNLSNSDLPGEVCTMKSYKYSICYNDNI